MNALRRIFRPQYVIPAVIVLLVLARIGLHYGAELTVKGAFYDALGMGGAYATRWHSTVVLALIGVGVALVLSLPLLLLRGRARPIVLDPEPAGDPSDPRGDALLRRFPGLERHAENFAREPGGRLVRAAVILAWLVTFALLIAVIAPPLAGARDRLLAWRNRSDFGAVDPVFGNDVGFYVFTEPALTTLARIALGALALTLVAVIVVGLGLALIERQRIGRAASLAILSRTAGFGFALGGLLLLVVAGLIWLSRYALTRGGDGDIIAGAGQAVRSVDIPTRTVGAIFVAVLALGLIALAVPGVRALAARVPTYRAILSVAVAWTGVALVLTVVATPWWLILLIPAAAAALWARRLPHDQPLSRRPAPVLFWPATAAASTFIVALLGPVGAALNDAIVLRGSQLQVERENIAATLEATRRASGIDTARTVEANYRQGGVTREAIAKAPASVASLRFLDIPPTQEACSRLQTINQFYTCNDVDIDRYTIEGRRRTLFTIGREIDYSKLTDADFQRRHFTYTHGYGLIMAPVDEIERTGRPVFVVGNIPQTVRGDFIQPPPTQPSIYFGAQPNMPWAMVNTDQPEFDRQTNQKITWTGGTGVAVGSGWRRLALTEFLGGLPYVGGGRRVWNATSGRPADADSQTLLYRDITSRLNEIAPFLEVDSDPYFTAAEGRLWVVANAYVTTSRYPYAVAFGRTGANYARHTVTAVMDAYSGETKLFVVDEDEPITKTWRAVYPELFASGSQIPQGLRPHLRYGEDLFNFQSAALERFHVTDTDVFFNGDDAWAITEEAYGPGVTGSRIESPARYTYVVLPNETSERFVAVRAYKPAARGRGIGFSGWLAASNEPEDFGALTILRFPTSGDKALDSLDTFTSNVARDADLSQEITTRREQVLRGNTIVVPIGEGLLYVQPLYLDAPGDSLPTLWQVIVSFGDGRVYAADTFAAALAAALSGSGGGQGTDGGGGSPPSGQPGTLEELVRRAAAEYEAYRKAFGAGDDEEAARRLKAFQDALAAAQRLAGSGNAPSAAPAAPTGPAP